MQPPRIKSLLAQTWIWLLIVYPIVCGISFTVGSLGYPDRGKIFFITAVAAFIIIPITLRIFASIQNAIVKSNGEPFEIGDNILILKGSHKGKQADVYELWQERGQIRVNLGDEAANDFSDVFSSIEVMRCPCA